MQNTETKTNNSVKSKLVAAIAMLLVATIMVVSSTYAWFTLSTKPEVTGISTAVGANGALEMLLSTKDAQDAWDYNDGTVSTEDWTVRNTYWGNLVNLENGYGTDKITLYPSTLNVADGVISDVPIMFPEYGSDGRVVDLSQGGSFGTYDGENFYADSNYGFRALGKASGLTARQQNFRVALSEITVKSSAALKAARNSLSENGNTLASIAIKKAMTPESDFTADEIAAVGDMIDGIETALANVEAAYLEVIYATIYSSESGLEDDVAIAAVAAAKDDVAKETSGVLGAKITAVIEAATKNGATFDTDKLPNYTKFTAAMTALTTAQTRYAEISAKSECTWTELSAALYPLVDIEVITINNYTPADVKENAGKIAADALGGKGINVVIPTDGGVFADIADYAGDYTVSITIDTAPLGVAIEGGVKANMKADSTLDTSIFAAAKTAINVNKPAGGNANEKPLTEFYGYVIDLAFRTNASQSNLLLQTTPADRIYGDNQNDETLGNGSTMTFATTAVSFTETQMLNLMDKLEVVFFSPDDGTILGYAKLDTANATGTAVDGLTANLLMLDENKNLITDPAQAVITQLSPGVEHRVSVLVYLNGENISNADVAAVAEDAKSMSGTLNLQFASSANLVPMEYADLHQVTETENDGGEAQG